MKEITFSLGFEIPELIAEKLLKKDVEYYILRWLAGHHNTDFDILEALSKHPDSLVRWGVAANPITPIEILNSLKKDEDFLVRMRVKHSLKLKKLK